jgi:hypothetical protein
VGSPADHTSRREWPVSSNGAENWVPASSLLDIFSILLKNMGHIDERDVAFTGVARLL